MSDNQHGGSAGSAGDGGGKIYSSNVLPTLDEDQVGDDDTSHGIDRVVEHDDEEEIELTPDRPLSDSIAMSINRISSSDTQQQRQSSSTSAAATTTTATPFQTGGPQQYNIASSSSSSSPDRASLRRSQSLSNRNDFVQDGDAVGTKRDTAAATSTAIAGGGTTMADPRMPPVNNASRNKSSIMSSMSSITTNPSTTSNNLSNNATSNRNTRAFMHSTSSGGSGFTSNINRKSVLIRNSLARRSTATFSRFASSGSGSGSGSGSRPGGGSSGSQYRSGDDLTRSGRSRKAAAVTKARRMFYSVGEMVFITSTSTASPATGQHSISSGADSGTAGPNPASVDRDISSFSLNTAAVRETAAAVNIYGYPRGEGRTAEEQRGPYSFVLGKVKQIHYEENAVFYTVTRFDTDTDVRGDTAFIEPIQSQEGLEAAMRAAMDARNAVNADQGDENQFGEDGEYKDDRSGLLRLLEDVFALLLLPFIWIYDIFVISIGGRLFRWCKKLYMILRGQAILFLNGMQPYACSMQFTTVNIIVLCSTWYTFIDQLRLAFFPATADYGIAVTNFVIFTILTLELIFEVFIRPDGYYRLINSEKAFSPTTARYICRLHLVVEVIALVFFVPEFQCIFQSADSCGGRPKFSFLRSTLLSLAGSSRLDALIGRAFYVCVRMRVFGLVRHWRNMWISKKFLRDIDTTWDRHITDRKSVNTAMSKSQQRVSLPERTSLKDYGDSTVSSVRIQNATSNKVSRKQRDAAVIRASNIGTALMVTNSYRALTTLCLIMGIFPMISLIYLRGVVNDVATDQVEFLQGVNLQLTEENRTNCEYLAETVESWVESFSPRDQPTVATDENTFLVGLTLGPGRCNSSFVNLTAGGLVFGVIPCPDGSNVESDLSCIVGQLEDTLGTNGISSVVDFLDIRIGNIMTDDSSRTKTTFIDSNGLETDTEFFVSGAFNYTHSTESAAFLCFLLQLFLLMTVIAGLIVLRYDSEHVVLAPLRSMLKIVARYAKNPLSRGMAERDSPSVLSDDSSHFSIDEDDDASEGDGFGTYETEQLISAVSKITDLLRKCWGVAGADIISTNLASREGELVAEVFNPTVPGKSVYALFAFAAITGFDHALKCLAGDVMILINDVAKVLHDEVYRWGFGDSGQCNKNLGNTFLMVFRIGLVKEVVEKLEEATKVVFSTSDVKKVSVKKRSRDKLPMHVRKASADSATNPLERWRVAPNTVSGLTSKLKSQKSDAMADAMQLSLQSLPGISTFTDRAVLGMLKSFAGIHRDNSLRAWSRDFRLSAGVGAWSVNMIFGMDAGWAVEGAVGSEYKIDATYLSPHVNMASRMMSACKHYGVTILLSEAVQELMSGPGRRKLRNLDRVTVKGSAHVQNIYTYDARSKGADFFLYSRSDDQADSEAADYKPDIWNEDQDLKAMRHHVTDDFEQEFKAGMKDYYEGNWPSAIEKLEAANEIMVDAAMEEGYLHDEMDDSPDRKELYRTETADGPCKYLITFMKSKGGVAPKNWDGWHPLLSK